MKGKTVGISTLIVAAILLAVVWTSIGGAQGIGRHLAELQNLHSQAGDDPVVATVNGHPITLHTIEVSAQTIRITDPELDERQAFKIALARTVLNTALYRKAREAGITVSRKEAEAVYERTKEMARQNPITKEYFDTLDRLPPAQRKAIEDMMVEGYRQAIAVSRWRERMVQQYVPQPTQEEVEAYLKAHPRDFRNHLVLSTIYFEDGLAANQVYAKMQKAQSRVDTDVEALLRQIARQYNPQRGNFTEAFTFITPDQLPDYARDALHRKAKSIHLFRRSDGTYVVYRIEHVDYVPKERIYEQVSEKLWQEKKQAYVDHLMRKVLEKANIRIYEERLPKGIHVTKEDILEGRNRTITQTGSHGGER